MSVRTKTKRRLAILLTGTFLLIGLATGAYFLRQRQLNNRAKEARVEGVAAAKAGDYPVALHRVGLYLQRYPNDAEALFYYGQARENVPLLKAQHIFQAMAIYRRVLDLNPDDMRARHALMDLYLRGGYMTEAETADVILSGTKLDRAKDDIPAVRAKAISLANLKARDKASMDEALHWAELAPEEVDAYALVMGLMLKNEKSASDIVQYAEGVCAAHPPDAKAPRDPRFVLLRSKAYLMAGEAAKWREGVLTAAESDLADPGFVEGLVEQLDAVRRYDLINSIAEDQSVEEKAFEVLSRPQASSAPKVQRLLMARLWQAGRAQQIADRLATLDPTSHASDTLLLAYRAMALFKLGRASEAMPILTALNKDNRPADPVANAWSNYLRVACADTQIDDKRLIQVCEEGLAIQPSNPYFLYSAGEAYSRMGETDLAIQQWSQAAGYAPTWSAPLVQQAKAYTSTGRFEEGTDAAKIARQVAPKDPAAMAALVASAAPWLNVVNEESRTELLKLADEVQKLSPGEEQTLSMKVALLAKSDRRDEAIALVRSLAAAKPAVSEALLLDLSSVSAGLQLGVDDVRLDASEKAHGVSAELAMAKALRLFRQKQPEEGLKLFDAARSATHTGDELSWQMQRARYLDLMWQAASAQPARDPSTRPSDPRAAQAIKDLGDSHATDLKVQWMVLSARSVVADYEFIGRTIDRIRSEVGDKGLAWRMARAKWLMAPLDSDSPADAEKKTAEASSLLSDVIRADPDILEPRILLARALDNLDNTSGAVQQMTEAAAKWPKRMSIQLDLARLLQKQAEYDRARECLDKVVPNTTATPDEIRIAASLLAQQGDLDRSLDRLAALHKAYGDEKQQPADLMMAALYQQESKWPEAEEIYRQLLKAPDAGTIQAAVAFYLAWGKRQDAERVLAMLDTVTAAPGAKELIRGDYQQRIGDWEKALANYYAAVKAAPNRPALWRQIIVTHLSLKQIDAAMTAANQALIANPKDLGLAAFKRQTVAVAAVGANEQFRPIVVAMLTGDRDRIALAESVLSVIVDSQRKQEPPGQLADRLRPIADKNENVDFLPLQNLLARMYAAAGRLNEAVAIANRTMHTFPREIEPAKTAAVALAVLRRPADALAAAQEWRKRSLSNPLEADLTIAGLSPPKEAMARLDQYMKAALDKPDENVAIITRYATAQIASGQASAAQEMIKPWLGRSALWRGVWMELVAVAVPPKDVSSWMATVAAAIPATAVDERVDLASAWRKVAARTQDPAHVQAARDALGRVTQEVMTATNPNAVQLSRVASIHTMSRDDKGAEAVYRKALEIDPAQPGSNNNLADILRQRGDLAGAEKLALRAVQSNDPSVGNYWDTLATIQAQMQKYPEAIASIEEAVKRNPWNTDWLRNQARIYDVAGKPDLAEPAYRKVLQVMPDDPVCNNNLAMIVLRKGGDLNLREAIGMAKRAVAARPDIGEFYDTLADVQAANKDYSAALDSIAAALKLDSKNVDWRITEAFILDSSGDLEKARSALQQIDALQPKPSDLSDTSRKRLNDLREHLTTRAGAQ